MKCNSYKTYVPLFYFYIRLWTYASTRPFVLLCILIAYRLDHKRDTNNFHCKIQYNQHRYSNTLVKYRLSLKKS